MAKSYWTGKEGKKAITAAAAADAAGSMKVGPGVRNSGITSGGSIRTGMMPGAPTIGGALSLGKQITSTGTGYGSFRNPTYSGGAMTSGPINSAFDNRNVKNK